MPKTFITNQPAINFTVVGFGQAGSRIADQFARFRDTDEKQIYNSLALNSNDGDLKELRYIKPENRFSLGLGGLGKNPEKAIKLLNENDEVNEKMKEFISNKIRPQDDVVMFIAGLGGGTGTSTIIKAISEFYDHHNKPLIREELEKLIVEKGTESFKNNQSAFLNEALNRAKERFKKIVVIATLPLRSDGADVLRQVNNFTQQIWELAQDPTKGIAHVIFPDNQFFYDKFKEIPKDAIPGIENYRDYANKEIVNIIHELNTAVIEGDASIVFDKEDLRRVWLDHQGAMFYSKVEVPASKVKNADDLVELFKKAFEENALHGPVDLYKKEEDKLLAKKIFHVGLFAIVDNKNQYGKGAFIETAKELFDKQFVTSEDSTVFTGFIEDHNNGNITVYFFYKADALPERLEKGLVEEYEEFKKRQENISYTKSEIKQIEKDNNMNLNLTLDSLGLNDDGDLLSLLGESKEEKSSDNTDNQGINKLLDNVDFDSLLKKK